jgi:hypothetical protein
LGAGNRPLRILPRNDLKASAGMLKCTSGFPLVRLRPNAIK